MGLSGLYYIVNVKAKTVVDLYSPPGIDINGWQSTWDLPGKNQNQIWTITEVSDGHVVITNCWTGTYLSAPKTLEQSTNPPTTIEARSLATASKPTDSYVRWIPKEQNGGSYV
ncbi:hypothetical protein DL95DRAFT_467699 [Leptodontidium sp. 2 PMI_412]|nr:hypothetical protein BKA61DRAFT_576092 [Leptodontidium sp. MPI-SDFR-AT-0119]KAH9208470.1 hypothetical protein DL95DRAFT_467699 [Leptodontidium sp. 2 PMI_412]